MELLSSLRRRWILASVLLLMTLAGTVYALLKLPPTYQAQSSVVLLVPKNVAKAYGGNPYLAFNSTLNMTADVVRYETTDVRTANLLAAQGYTSTYLVTDAFDTAGPVLNVTVTGHNEAAVEHTLYGVTSQVSSKLSGLQAGLAGANKIQDVVITFTPKPTVLSSKKARPLSVVVGAGLMLTVGIPLIVDAVLVRRRPSVARSREEDRGQRSPRDPVRIANDKRPARVVMPSGKVRYGRHPGRSEEQTGRRP
jgi:capsular polysaccharide biosynthesis protein